VPRDKLPQDEPTDHMMEANAASIIFISRRRLCSLSSKDTRQEWQQALDELKNIDPELVDVCVPECVYIGLCPEPNCCGFYFTSDYNEQRSIYIDLHRKCNEKRKK